MRHPSCSTHARSRRGTSATPASNGLTVPAGSGSSANAAYAAGPASYPDAHAAPTHVENAGEVHTVPSHRGRAVFDVQGNYTALENGNGRGGYGSMAASAGSRSTSSLDGSEDAGT
ncbi:hypothetical protein BJ912DRAFT_1065818 [Pholiota molesta]|nr:hypothetical protein BJ912DRAFT_1065818 [Pholiota molesta]